jgi:septal ring factor EnvC (AmiA/AmiB activator)
MRQREVELELERIAESQRKVQNQIERESVTPDEVEGSLEDMTADRMQLLQKKAEVRQELERVLAERQRIHEDFQGLTGMRIPGH